MIPNSHSVSVAAVADVLLLPAGEGIASRDELPDMRLRLNRLKQRGDLPPSSSASTTAIIGTSNFAAIPKAASTANVSANSAADAADVWAQAAVRKIRRGDQAGIQDLYNALSEGACARLLRRVDPQFQDDRRHEILLIVVEAICAGELRDPNRLMGFVWTITRRSVAAYIRGAIFQRQRFVPSAGTELLMPAHQSPEARVAERERIERVKLMLGCLRPRDREILERFYLREQSRDQICREMRLTGTQFRLYKSRAIARCGDRMRRGFRG